VQGPDSGDPAKRSFSEFDLAAAKQGSTSRILPMISTKLSVPTPKDFSFWRTVLSHGWCTLAPFYLEQEERLLRRVLRTTGSSVLVDMQESVDGHIALTVHSHRPLRRQDLTLIQSQVVRMLRLDESLQAFYEVLAETPGNGEFEWVTRAKAGRLLRGPSLFEDVAKMICTTNCAWSATQRMVENLVSKLGSRFSDSYSDFPTPEQLAATPEKFLIEEIRAGYRSAYLLELAENVAKGCVDFQSWENLTGEELYKQILLIKGVGPYAAGNLLRLLGHYHHLALDSWCRPKYSEIYRQGRKVSDATIARHYKKYGRWSGLVLWLDLTRDWFGEEKRRPF
jgi:3-methyladenine DNA glycosylase/8-oxoguanine DNA glycosylase